MPIVQPLKTGNVLRDRFLLFFLLVSAAVASDAADTTDKATPTGLTSIKLGILPYLSSHALIREWKPFIDAMEDTLNKNVVLNTAPNYKSYLKRSIDGHYDVIVTAPHFAALLVREHKFNIVAGFSKPLSGDIVVAENSPYHALDEIKGKTFATPDNLAIISILGELKVIELGLTPGTNVKMKHMPSHNAALHAVLDGKADYAVAVGGLYKKLSTAEHRFRLITHTRSVPHVMILARSGLAPEDIHSLSGFFLNDRKNGKRHALPQPGWGKLIRVDTRSLNELDSTLPLLRAKLVE